MFRLLSSLSLAIQLGNDEVRAEPSKTEPVLSTPLLTASFKLITYKISHFGETGHCPPLNGNENPFRDNGHMQRKLRLPHELGRWRGYMSQHVARLFSMIGVGRGRGLIQQKVSLTGRKDGKVS